jgi:hypothetical protein
MNEDDLDLIADELKNSNLTSTGEMKEMKNNILQKMLFDKDELKLYHKLLTNYRYIDEIDELKYGSYLRWFKLNEKESMKLMKGGFIIEIKQNNKHEIVIVCKNYGRIFSLKMNECIIFQKNTSQEELLIKILDYVKRI